MAKVNERFTYDDPRFAPLRDASRSASGARQKLKNSSIAAPRRCKNSGFVLTAA